MLSLEGKLIFPITLNPEIKKKIPTGVDITGWKVDFNAHLEIKQFFIFEKGQD